MLIFESAKIGWWLAEATSDLGFRACSVLEAYIGLPKTAFSGIRTCLLVHLSYSCTSLINLAKDCSATLFCILFSIIIFLALSMRAAFLAAKGAVVMVLFLSWESRFRISNPSNLSNGNLKLTSNGPLKIENFQEWKRYGLRHTAEHSRRGTPLTLTCNPQIATEQSRFQTSSHQLKNRSCLSQSHYLAQLFGNQRMYFL